jgi:mannose-6-phosphate isomerase-like protein (cupin superfamily)
MAGTTQLAFELLSTYVHLADGGDAVSVAVDASFWAEIGSRIALHGGRLVGVTHQTGDWPTWERHPAGDELIVLLSGAVDIVLQDQEGERVVELRRGAASIVPRGVWHRFIVCTPGYVLFITPGSGTQHRPL